MNRCLLILPGLLLSFFAQPQTLCGTAPEGGTVTLTAPAGHTFISVTFASYGTPNGSCGAFTIGGCHAANSMSIVQTALIGNNSASIPATNGVFGDPCGGTVKRLYIEAVYGVVTPLTLISFSGSTRTNSNILQWETADEKNIRYFDIESSNDGIEFLSINTVAANNQPGNNHYSYIDSRSSNEKRLYRLKILDNDGKYVYSNIIKLSAQAESRLEIFPNPVTNHLTISGLTGKGWLEILSADGNPLHKLNVSDQTQTINMSAYSPGFYILRYNNGKEMIHQKVLKQ